MPLSEKATTGAAGGLRRTAGVCHGATSTRTPAPSGYRRAFAGKPALCDVETEF